MLSVRNTYKYSLDHNVKIHQLGLGVGLHLHLVLEGTGYTLYTV